MLWTDLLLPIAGILFLARWRRASQSECQACYPLLVRLAAGASFLRDSSPFRRAFYAFDQGNKPVTKFPLSLGDGSNQHAAPMKLKTILVVCCVAFISLPSARAATVQVQVGAGGLKFTPQNVTIHVGDTVQWTWAASGHSTTSGTPGLPDGIWDSGVQNSGFVFNQTFTSAGTFAYYCTPHGSCCGMIGSVMVTAATDTVQITRAQYTSTRSQLTVQATESDSSALLTVSVTSTGTILGPMHGNGGRYSAKFNGISNPVNITVTSNLGGSASAPVRGR